MDNYLSRVPVMSAAEDEQSLVSRLPMPPSSVRESGSEALRLHCPFPYYTCASSTARSQWSPLSPGTRRQRGEGDRKWSDSCGSLSPEVGANTCIIQVSAPPSTLKGAKCDTGGFQKAEVPFLGGTPL